MCPPSCSRDLISKYHPISMWLKLSLFRKPCVHVLFMSFFYQISEVPVIVPFNQFWQSTPKYLRIISLYIPILEGSWTLKQSMNSALQRSPKPSQSWKFQYMAIVEYIYIYVNISNHYCELLNYNSIFPIMVIIIGIWNQPILSGILFVAVAISYPPHLTGSAGRNHQRSQKCCLQLCFLILIAPMECWCCFVLDPMPRSY